MGYGIDPDSGEYLGGPNVEVECQEIEYANQP
jgi:hypothetical protein